MLIRKQFSSALFCLAFGLTLISSSFAQGTSELPKIEGENLAGRKVTLPDAAEGKVAVLIFGFTKASKNPTSAWARKVQADFGAKPGFELYQLPVLEDVPRLFRGMVISGIRKGVPENVRDHFVPIVQNESELKRIVSYKEPDDAYLMVLGQDGRIVQQSHGAPTDANYTQLRAEIESLLNQK